MFNKLIIPYLRLVKLQSLDADILLTDRLRRGDHEAFREVFENHWLGLYDFARRIIKSDEDTKEIVQSVFLELWEKRDRFEIENLGYYLKACIRNKCIDYIRTQHTRNKYFEHFKAFCETASNTTEEQVAHQDLAEQIDETLRAMPEKSQLIFRLNKLEGFTIHEISQKVNLSTKAVEYHLTKANKALKLSLKS